MPANAPSCSPVAIVPSVLPVDFARLGSAVQDLEAAGADRIQWDVMDGRFVPNITFGADVIASARPHVKLPFEAHLMIEEPQTTLTRYAAAGCERIIVHAEACRHLHRTLAAVGESGAKAGVALNPASPIDLIVNVLDLVDLVLIMTVNPGFGGQEYIATMEPKIRQMKDVIAERKLPVAIEVDGGMSATTIGGAAQAGATAFVTGSALFSNPRGLAEAIAELRHLAAAASGQDT